MTGDLLSAHEKRYIAVVAMNTQLEIITRSP